MDLLDAVSRGMDRLANKIDEFTGSRTDAPFDTGYTVMDKDYCWEDLDYVGEETLQRHIVSGECRIVDKFGQVVARGTQPQLEALMERRQAQLSSERSAAPAFGPVPFAPQQPATFPTQTVQPVQPVQPDNAAYVPLQPVQARYGDIIGVIRHGGAYEHYGIYVSDTCVIHYAIPASMTIGNPTVHATDLKNFLRDDSQYFVLDFPHPYEPPVRIGAPQNTGIASSLASSLKQQYGYHLYTPEQTVERAKSRLGETGYRLLTNNCEHFAIWCKTGVSESIQVSGMLRSLLNAKSWQFRRPAHW